MISNDNVLNASSFMLLFLLLLLGVCFFIFVYKNLGSAKVGKDSFLYFNYMFFKRDALSDSALIFLVLGYVAAAIAEYRRGFDDLSLISNLSGGMSFLLFALYGKYFYQGLMFPDYVALLKMRNGFYGFESALHVFPGTHEQDDFNVFSWNEEKLWRESYGGMTDGHFFFAEDAFGGQFSLKEDGIYSFDPETGESQKMCENLSQWCDAILNDYDFLTGHSLMHQWQITHGKIKQNQRLVPVIPFVLGGEFSVKNLRAQQSVTAMRARGSIAVQIRDVPDGGTIKLNVDD